MNYIFGLFDSMNQLIDQTSIDENDAELAYQLFVDFSKHEGYVLDETSGYYVKLIQATMGDAA